MLAELTRGGGEQHPDRRGGGERLAFSRRRGQLPDGLHEAGGDVVRGAVGRGQRHDRADRQRGGQRAPGRLSSPPGSRQHLPWSPASLGRNGWFFPYSRFFGTQYRYSIVIDKVRLYQS